MTVYESSSEVERGGGGSGTALTALCFCPVQSLSSVVLPHSFGSASRPWCDRV